MGSPMIRTPRRSVAIRIVGLAPGDPTLKDWTAYSAASAIAAGTMFT